MRKILLKILLFIYLKFLKSGKFKILIKKLFGNHQLLLNYRSFKIFLGVKNSIQMNIIFDDYNEEIILDYIEKYIKLNYTFVDIGANIGVHTLSAASINSKAEIFCFEPEPENYFELIRNIQANNFKNIIPFKVAMGNQIDNLKLNVNDGWNKGKHSIKNHLTKVKHHVNVPVLTLDLFQESLKNKDLLIKIDVEGFEKEVITGATSILSTNKNIVLIIELISEINSLEVCNEIFENLTNLGFTKVYKTENEKLIDVLGYENSSDYIFIKNND